MRDGVMIGHIQGLKLAGNCSPAGNINKLVRGFTIAGALWRDAGFLAMGFDKLTISYWIMQDSMRTQGYLLYAPSLLPSNIAGARLGKQGWCPCVRRCSA